MNFTELYEETGTQTIEAKDVVIAKSGPVLAKKDQKKKDLQEITKEINDIVRMEEWIKKHDAHYIGGSVNEYIYWISDVEEEAVIQDGVMSMKPGRLKDMIIVKEYGVLVKEFPEIFGSVGGPDYHKSLGKMKRLHSSKSFSDEERYRTYNTIIKLQRNQVSIDPRSVGEMNPILECLFYTATGECPISKDVLEKSYVSLLHLANTEKYSIRPPTFILFGNGGTGKSRLFNNFARKVFGVENCSVVSPDAAVSGFNDYIIEKRHIFFNELGLLSSDKRAKLGEEIKGYDDDFGAANGKGSKVKDVLLVGMVALSTNSMFGPFDLDKTDNVTRRFQVIEGKRSFNSVAKERGLLDVYAAQAGVDLKKCTKDQLESIGTAALTDVLNVSTITKHMNYLYRKHYAELNRINWKVSGVENESFRQLMRNQQGAWVEKMAQYLKDNCDPKNPIKISALLEVINELAKEDKNKPKTEGALIKEFKQLKENHDVLKFFEFFDQKSIQIGHNRRSHRNIIWITKQHKEEMMKLDSDDVTVLTEELRGQEPIIVPSVKTPTVDSVSHIPNTVLTEAEERMAYAIGLERATGWKDRSMSPMDRVNTGVRMYDCSDWKF